MASPLTLEQFENLTLAEVAAHWPEVRATVEENARLRGLIDYVERVGEPGYGDSTWCPWCDAGTAVNGPEVEPGAKHTKDCPAFTQTGEVR